MLLLVEALLIPEYHVCLFKVRCVLYDRLLFVVFSTVVRGVKV